MNCGECEILISAYADGELSGRDRARLQAHLNRCESCERVYQETVRLQRDLSDALMNGPETPDLVQAVTDAIRPRPRTWFSRAWAAAAVLALIAVCGYLLFAPTRETRPHRQPATAISAREPVTADGGAARSPSPLPRTNEPEPRVQVNNADRAAPEQLVNTSSAKRPPARVPDVKRPAPILGPSPMAVDEAEIAVRYTDSLPAAERTVEVPLVSAPDRAAAGPGRQVATETEVVTADGQRIRQVCYRVTDDPGANAANDDETPGGPNEDN